MQGKCENGRWAAALAWFLVGHPGSWLYTTAMLSNIVNFELELRGYVAGITTSVFGLSIATLVSLYRSCLGGTVEDGGVCVGASAVFGGHGLARCHVRCREGPQAGR